MFCRAYGVVVGESECRSQYTPCIKEDEGLDDQATSRVRKCVLLSTNECSYDHDTQDMEQSKLAERLHDLSV
jgi:hypothetical protein